MGCILEVSCVVYEIGSAGAVHQIQLQELKAKVAHPVPHQASLIHPSVLDLSGV